MASEETILLMNGIATKRKRFRPDIHATDPARHHGATNPYSRTPGQILQFRLAGLNDNDQDPSIMLPGFPHKRGHQAQTCVENDVGTDAEEGNEEQDKRWYLSYRIKQLHVLLQSIEQFLDSGDVAKAAKTYALVLQLQTSGRHIDVRHHDIWALGAEILMREGEVSPVDVSDIPKRWGSAANMNKVKAYFETLIQQHPYNYKSPWRVSALDFNLAMFGCEIYNAYAEHTIALELLNSKGPESEDEMDIDGVKIAATDRDASLIQHKERLRRGALQNMVEITKRMDRLIQDQPYDRNNSFLRLRATGSLYLIDLIMPITGSGTQREVEQALDKKEMEQRTAFMYLSKVFEAGSKLDEPALAFLRSQWGDAGLPDSTHASLPIRGL